MLQHQQLVTVVHKDSGFNFGTMRTKSGAGKNGDGQQVRPGGMAPPEAFPGTYEYDALEVTRMLRHTTDTGLVQKARDLYGERFAITAQPLDSKGRPGFHRAETYGGILNTITPSEYDADGNDPQVLTLGFVLDTEL